MAEFSIFNPQVTKVVKGLGNKVITLIGNSGTGKTKQCSRFSKPLFICFEEGTGALGNQKKLPVETWVDFVRYNKDLTSSKTNAQARELYDTIILDSVDAMEKICVDYICMQKGVKTISEIPHGAGWKLFEDTFWREINKITKSGFTVVFIGHPTDISKEGQSPFMHMKGDLKRVVEPIIARSDLVAFLVPQGTDENGKSIHSSAWFVQTDQFFARCRFEQIVPYIEEFTAEALEKELIKAIEAEEKEYGSEYMTTYEENEIETAIERKSYEELMDELQTLGQKFAEAGKMDDLKFIVTQHIGDKKASELRKGQEPVIEAIIDDFKEFLESEGL